MPVPILIYAVVSVLAGCGSSAFKPSNSESDVDVNDADDSSSYIAPDVDVIVTDVAPAVDLPKNIDSGMDAPVPKDISQEIKAEVTETTDVPSTDISSPSNDVCIPVTCTPDKIYYKGNVGRCISFSKSVLVADGPHLKVSVADVNGDLLPDIYVLNNDQTHQLYINKNGNSFFESSALYSLNLKGPSYGALWGDMDQDSDLDLLLMNKMGTSLYVNDGGKYSLKLTLGAEEAHAALWFNGGILLGTVNSLRFYQPSANWMYKEVAKEIGLFDGGDGHGLAAADYDMDGDMDVFVANETGMNRMFENDGGKFKSVEEKAKLVIPGQIPSVEATWINSAQSTSPMLYVANYGAGSEFYSRQSDGTYVNIAPQTNLKAFGNTTRAAWGDFLNDGSPSLFVARMSQESPQENLLLVPVWNNAGQITDYKDIAYPYGLSTPAMMVDAQWADLNGDGQLDLITAAYDGAVAVYYNETKVITGCK